MTLKFSTFDNCTVRRQHCCASGQRLCRTCLSDLFALDLKHADVRHIRAFCSATHHAALEHKHSDRTASCQEKTVSRHTFPERSRWLDNERIHQVEKYGPEGRLVVRCGSSHCAVKAAACFRHWGGVYPRNAAKPAGKSISFRCCQHSEIANKGADF